MFMNKNMYMVARRPNWKVLEDFYKGVEGGEDKVLGMRRYCKASDAITSYTFFEPHYAEVNHTFLLDRHRKLNQEFVWTEENLGKLIALDQHIRKLEYEMYQKFVEIKKNLDGLIAQGFSFYKDYQVTCKIDYDALHIDDDEHDRRYDWVQSLLQDYADLGVLEWFTFGDGDEPDDPRTSEGYIFDAWGKWLEYDYFVKNGMTVFLCHLMDELNHSLYTYEDIVNMDLNCFYLDYEISF